MYGLLLISNGHGGYVVVNPGTNLASGTDLNLAQCANMLEWLERLADKD